MLTYAACTQPWGQTAFGELYDQHRALVRCRIIRIVGDRGVADELVQETFLSAWTQAHRFDAQRGTFGTWLATIARNRSLDYLRSSAGRWSVHTARLDESAEPRVSDDHEQRDSISRKTMRLCGAIQKLGVHHRKVIDLAYFGGLSHSEIALKLGCPLGTVKSRVRSALEILREDLALKPDAGERRGQPRMAEA